MSALAAPFRPAGSDRIDPVLVALWLILLVIAVAWIAPFVFIVFTSLKSNSTVMGSSAFAPPTSLAFENFAAAWRRGHFSVTVLNSALITVVKVPLGLCISAMAAYALSRIRLPAGRAIFLLVLFGTMLPFQVMLAPLFTLVNGFVPLQHLCRHHPSLSRVRRALSGVHPARVLQRSSQRAQRSRVD